MFRERIVSLSVVARPFANVHHRHTEGSAGLASLISSALALQHGTIPPNLHFQNLSPKVAPFYSHLEIPTSARPWPTPLPGQPRRASVNSFGKAELNTPHRASEVFWADMMLLQDLVVLMRTQSLSLMSLY